MSASATTLYLAFAGGNYYPNGGIGDHQYTETDRARAIARWSELSSNDWWQIAEVPEQGEPTVILSGQRKHIDPEPKLH